MSYFINVIAGLILVWAVFQLLQKVFPNKFGKNLQQQLQKTQETARKQDGDRIGKRFIVPRDNKQGVTTNLYLLDTEGYVQTVFLCHGGTLMDGDADQMDSFCNRMKDLWQANIISINYAKLNEHQIPWQQEEVVDTVKYFVEHASEYHVDGSKLNMVGFSGGAYILNGAAALLTNFGIKLNGIVEFYPLIDDSIIRLTDAGLLQCPIAIVTCNHPEMNKRCAIWYEHLQKVNPKAEMLEYPSAIQGFIEYNNPEFSENPLFKKNIQLFDEDQENMARACEIRIKGLLQSWNDTTVM